MGGFDNPMLHIGDVARVRGAICDECCDTAVGSGRGRTRGRENVIAVEPKSETETPNWLVRIDLIRGAVSSQFTFAHTVSPSSFLPPDVSFNANSTESIQ